MLDQREHRALEFEALANEAQALVIESQGMKYENEQRKYLGQSIVNVKLKRLVMCRAGDE